MARSMLLFDMRSPAFGAPLAALYPAALEMASFADRVGIDRVLLGEHHGSEEGYLPSPFVLGAAMAGRTKSLRILLSAIILPLHDPVEVAEQIAVLDQISAGRLEVVFGAGYVPSEFARFGVAYNQRGRLLDEGLDVIVRALSGERFEHRGREVFVRPLSVQQPHPKFFVAGGVEAAARRAARFGMGFAPMHGGLWDLYDAECRRLGREPGAMLGVGGPICVHVAEDPDAAWAQLEPHILHVAETYRRWAAEAASTNSTYAGLVDRHAVRTSGKYRVVTPDECVTLAAEQEAIHSSLVFQPLIGGLAPEIGWRSLELFATAVLPRLRPGK
jgi:alkanesulfonate monooxygenase SsuD/methylene tetrahydromethanopterin reductase-like flavin-dependent oxidoreductase (luciferase family)